MESFSPSLDEVKLGEPVPMLIERISVAGKGYFEGSDQPSLTMYSRFFLTDNDGNSVEEGARSNTFYSTRLIGWSYSYKETDLSQNPITYTPSATLPDGQYKLWLLYSIPEVGINDFREYNHGNYSPGYWEAEVKGGVMYFSQPATNHHLAVTRFDYPERVGTQSKINVTATIHNNGSDYYSVVSYMIAKDGTDTDPVEGQLIGASLIAELERRGITGRKIVILNDTVAVLLGMAAGLDKSKYAGFIGQVSGTGTNTCVSLPVSAIGKLGLEGDKGMIVNLESGKYDGIQGGDFDKMLDEQSHNPGQKHFEKLTAGVYLGEICHLMLNAAADEGLLSGECAEKVRALPVFDSAVIDAWASGEGFSLLGGVVAFLGGGLRLFLFLGGQLVQAQLSRLGRQGQVLLQGVHGFFLRGGDVLGGRHVEGGTVEGIVIGHGIQLVLNLRLDLVLGDDLVTHPDDLGGVVHRFVLHDQGTATQQ